MIEITLLLFMNINSLREDRFYSILWLVDFVHLNLDQSKERLHLVIHYLESHGCQSQLNLQYLCPPTIAQTSFKLEYSQRCHRNTINTLQVVDLPVSHKVPINKTIT